MPRTRHPKQQPKPKTLLEAFLKEYPDRSLADWHDVLAQMHKNYRRFYMHLDNQGRIEIMIPKGGE